MTKEDPTPGALARLRVVEVGEWVSTPFAAKLFADFGSDVVKVDRPGPGDPARTDGPFPGDRPGPNSSGLSLWRCGSVAVACSLLRRRGGGDTRLAIQRTAPAAGLLLRPGRRAVEV